MVLTNYIPLFQWPLPKHVAFNPSPKAIALNPSPNAPVKFRFKIHRQRPSSKASVKFHFKIDGRHEKVLNRTDRNGNVTWPHERAGIHSMGSYTSSRQNIKTSPQYTSISKSINFLSCKIKIHERPKKLRSRGPVTWCQTSRLLGRHLWQPL